MLTLWLRGEVVKVLDYGKLDLGCNPSFMRKNYFPKTSNRSLSQFPYKVDVFPLLKVLCLPKDIFDIFNEDTFPVSLQANMLCKVRGMHIWRLLNFWDFGPPPSPLSVPNSRNLPSFSQKLDDPLPTPPSQRRCHLCIAPYSIIWVTFHQYKS